jgi:BirA family biotin operon repressor/biotin-[acetyl-CoA-carboxylase] ligase
MANEINKEIILQLTEEGLFPGGVHVFDSVDSTNDWSLREIRQGRETAFVCIADHQSKGRGRRGRHWLSPSAANIYCSLAWHFELPVDRLGMLSLAQGVAVINALNEIGINDAWLKWPNDVLIDDEKIAGILIETGGVRANSCNAVIGIGLNFRMPENIMPESGIRWTDVAHSKCTVSADRNHLLAILLHQAVSMCRLYQHKAGAILEDIKDELDGLNNREVSVHLDNGDQLTGTALGVNERGELRVLADGNERVFNSADVSLRQVVYADG